MNSIKLVICCCAALSLLTAAPLLAQDAPLDIPTPGNDGFPQLETRETRSGKLEFTGGYPTKKTVAKLYDELDFQRACQAYVWAIPAATMEYTHQNYLHLSGGIYGRLIYTDGYDDAAIGVLTTNLTTPYYWFFHDLSKSGALVIEDPAGKLAGFINDIWQRHVVDFGRPGVFKGQGGKHIIVGPGQDVPEGAEAEGYHVVHCRSNVFFMVLRDLYPDFKEGRAMIEKFNSYPYSKRNDVKPLEIAPHAGRWMAFCPPMGMRYWEMLSNVINREPIEERDRFFTAMLRPLGIEKGKPFEPDDRQRTLLEEGAFVGRSMAMTIDFAKRDGLGFYAEGVNHVVTQVSNLEQESEHHEHLDERCAVFYECFTTSKGMTSTTPGIGSNYLSSYVDSNGDWLLGANQYVLHVPADVPAENFWSVTAYRSANACLILNEHKIGDRNSRHDLHYNDDGSVDIYFGPKAPKDLKQRKNWIPTDPNEGWFTWFRFYGPLQPHFDRTWVLPDYEKTRYESE